MAVAASAVPSAAAKPLASLNFSPDSPARWALTPDQFKFCSEALVLLKEKVHSPHLINQEFASLQVFWGFDDSIV